MKRSKSYIINYMISIICALFFVGCSSGGGGGSSSSPAGLSLPPSSTAQVSSTSPLAVSLKTPVTNPTILYFISSDPKVDTVP